MQNVKIEVIQGDITKQHVDAIVNAANTSLLGGGGVDGAIHRAGGKAILEECRTIGHCETGEAVITTGGNLPARHVIHTVGPVWSKSNAAKAGELLASAYRNSLRVAVANRVQAVAFPNISTGAYRFPKEEAAKIAIREVKDFMTKDASIKLVIFVCFDDANYKLYQKTLQDEGAS
ncbi:O-acetyl-ADP-ribose deacetylase [Mucilaginibacter hurinus]|uniref:O-acetyl-ADP-ribose deacetylase n=1 Tax=Mucilaginibacter hurinus TaxID=2201324 RepID=A0A367GQL8_9SPHI|nr:O-acetyl-ADP-ribose deacetylase [Mucilaginibacter hurinus]RCH55749.1 O-acetyl-ADP-ribose deacetylase [Mucilaginibacter hurinus]